MTIPQERTEDITMAVLLVGLGILITTVIVIVLSLLIFSKAYYGV